MKSLIKSTLLLLATIALSANTSFAQFKAGSGLVSISGAYTIFSVEDTDANINGGGFQLGYEVSNAQGNFAFGGGLGYLVGAEDIDDGQIRYSTLPFWLYGKFLFGPEKVKFFIPLALGYQISERQISGDVFTIQDTYHNWDSGISLGTGIGLNYYFSEKICGILSYNLQFLSNRYYKEGLAHVFNFGLGFQID
jgi:hypothetical protein